MNRLTDNDRHLGPITYGKAGWNPWILKFSTGDREDGPVRNNLTVYWFGYVAQINLPNIIQPFRQKHIAKSWDAETVKKMGRNYYFETFPREYGFCLCDGHLNIYLGRQTHDSSTTQDWGCFLPWTQWRFIRHSLYDLAGREYWTQLEKDRLTTGGWDAQIVADNSCPTQSFCFDDFDGERIIAKTKIEEREWRFGSGWFKWLSLFRSPKISRSLDIQFSKEVGREKGSWKGGTVSHGIDMEAGELHLSAFLRYCEKEHYSKNGSYKITFVDSI
jgi:hypothetical protein